MFGNFMLQLMQFEKRADGEVNDYYMAFCYCSSVLRNNKPTCCRPIPIQKSSVVFSQYNQYSCTFQIWKKIHTDGNGAAKITLEHFAMWVEETVNLTDYATEMREAQKS